MKILKLLIFSFFVSNFTYADSINKNLNPIQNKKLNTHIDIQEVHSELNDSMKVSLDQINLQAENDILKQASLNLINISRRMNKKTYLYGDLKIAKNK